MAQKQVLSLTRITLEYKGKIRLQPDRENAFAGASGGGDGPDVEPSLDANLWFYLYKSCCFHLPRDLRRQEFGTTPCCHGRAASSPPVANLAIGRGLGRVGDLHQKTDFDRTAQPPW